MPNPWTDDYRIPCNNGPVDQTQTLPGPDVPGGSIRNWVTVPRDGYWSLPPAGLQESSPKPAPAPKSIVEGVPDWLLLAGIVGGLWWLNKR